MFGGGGTGYRFLDSDGRDDIDGFSGQQSVPEKQREEQCEA